MFPAWTTRSGWRDITGRHVYAANDMGDAIDVGYQASSTSPVETSTSLRCFRILARNTTANRVTIIAFTVRGCAAKYQCISFVKRKDSVIELHKGMRGRVRRFIYWLLYISYHQAVSIEHYLYRATGRLVCAMLKRVCVCKNNVLLSNPN